MHLEVTVGNEGHLIEMFRAQLRKEALRIALDKPERKGKRCVNVIFDVNMLYLIVPNTKVLKIDWV